MNAEDTSGREPELRDEDVAGEVSEAQDVPETPETPEAAEALEAPEAEEALDAEEAATRDPVEGIELEESEELNIGQEQVLELVSYVVVNLVEHPDEVTVDIAQRQGRDIFQVRVHPDDLGKVIGKGGQTARALRVLLMAVSARTDQRIGLEIVE